MKILELVGPRVLRGALGVLLAASIVGSAGADGGGDMPTSRPALLLNGLGISQNWASWSTWAGLPSLPQPGAVSYVKGEWVVPTVACDATDDSSSVWVGIDGLFSGTVEQVGTEQQCVGGKAVYSAWWEMYPAPKTNTNLAVKPGDAVRGEVLYVGNGLFVLGLTNLSSGQRAGSIQSNGSAARSTASWVVEAPYKNGVLPLANFGKVTFDNARVTINGNTTGIGSASLLGLGNLLNTQRTQMQSSLLGGVKATTSGVSGGDGFTVNWVQN